MMNEYNTPDYLNQATQNGSLAAQQPPVPSFSLLNIQNNAELVRWREEAARVCHVSPEDIQDIYPCTVVQESLVALSIKSPHTYVARYLYRLPQDIDLDRFHAAFQTTVEAHTILRTRVVQMGSGEAVQVVVRQGIDCPRTESLKEYLDYDRQQTTQLGAPLARAAIARHEDGHYCFVFTLHHATYDDWALALFMKHIESAYYDIRLPTQAFSRFTQYCLDSSSKQAEEFWRSELSGKEFTPATFPALPSDMYRPAAIKSLIQVSSLEAPMDFDSASTVIKLAWAVLMAQHTDSDEVVFGVTDTGKRAPMSDMALMSGPTIATFPLRVRVPRKERIAEARKDLHAQRAHIVPFEQLGLHNISRLSTDVAAACRFQSLLVLQPPRRDDYELFTEVTNDFDLENHATFGTYPITLVIEPGPTSVSVQAVYDDQIVPEAQMQRILHQHAHLMKWINRSPDVFLEDIPALCPEDRDELALWNSQSTSQGTLCVHDLIAQKCAAQPEAPAVCSWDGEFSYRELDDLSTNVAARLDQTGHMAPDVIVPLYFEKSRWTAIAILAVIKAGGAFVLLDPSTPVKRLQTICEDTKAPFVLAPPELANQSAELIGKVVVLDDKATATIPSDRGLPSVRPNSILYIVFTSGSTGKPKGVVIEHGAFCASALAYIKTAGMSSETRSLQFASYAFDVSVTDHLATLLAGGCICIPSPEDRMNRIAEVVSKFQINYADFTPSFLRSLSPVDFPTLNTIVLGGEAMSRTDIETWIPHVLLLNIYGPAECCVLSTVQPDVATQQDPLDIGFATGGVCWIVDKYDHTKLVPIGAVGELLVGGPIVGRGYLNDPAKTAAAFVPKPAWLGDETPGRLYKTGDLVQYAANGSLRFLGRKDMQVKLRGQRVELGEVEYYLRQCLPSAAEIVAEVVKFSVQNTALLVAFIVAQSTSDEENLFMHPDSSAQAEQAQAESRLRELLPNYMIPSIFIRLGRLPLTATGKTNRKLLRETLSSLPPAELDHYTSTGSEKRGPATDQEDLVHRFVTQLLGLSPASVGMEDSLFRIGGDSITAMKLAGVMRNQGWTLNVADIFGNHKLEDMASIVRRQVSASVRDPIPPFSLISTKISPDECKKMASMQCGVGTDTIEDIYPTTPLQQGLFALSILNPGSYICHFVYQIPDEMTTEALQAAWESVCAATAILRTRFVQVGSDTMQAVVRDGTTQWSSPPNMEQHAVTLRARPIRLGGPLIQLGVTTRPGKSPSDQPARVWMVSIQHALCDGWSVPLYLERVIAAYRKTELTLELYSPFVCYTQQSSGAEGQAFWVKYFAGTQAKVFPTLPSESYRPTGRSLIKYVIRNLENKQTSHGMAGVISAAIGMMISHMTSTPDVVIGTVSTGRGASLTGIEMMAGPSMATLPVRMTFPPAENMEDTLTRFRQESAKTMAYEQIGLQALRTLSDETAMACLFQTYVNVWPASRTRAPEPFTLLQDGYIAGKEEAASSGYALSLHCPYEEDNLSVSASYDAQAISEDQVQQFLQGVEHIIREIWRRPMQTSRDILQQPEIRQTRSTPHPEQRKRFWIEAFRGTEPIAFPVLPSTSYTPTASSMLDITSQSPVGGVNSTPILYLAWAAILSQYAGVSDGLLELAVENEGSFQAFALRFQLDPESTVKQMIQATEAQVATTLPFACAGVDMSKCIGEMELAPKFHTLFYIQTGSESPEISQAPLSSQALVVGCYFDQGNIRFRVAYDANVISTSQVRRVIGQFEHMLQQMTNYPNETLAGLSTISGDDYQLLQQWNGTVPPAVDRRIHDIFQEVCKKQPDAPAICAWDGDLSYQALDEWSDMLAAQLPPIFPDTFVPLLFEKSRRTPVAILAVLKAGGAFVLLDPSHPLKRLQEICRDIEAPFILALPSTSQMAGELSTTVISVEDSIPEKVEREHAPDIDRETSSNSAAFCVFTSGSTGKPKASVIEHGNFCTSALTHGEIFYIGDKSRVLQFASYAFDISIAENITTLLMGGCVCIPSEVETRTDIARSIAKFKVNCALLTPPVARIINHEAVPSLKKLTLGGEAMTVADAQVWAPRVHLINSYGPSECSLVSTAQSEVKMSPRNIGKGTATVTWVVSPTDANHLVPIGAVGELLIEGPTVSRGYLNRPEETAAAFVVDLPWAAQYRSANYKPRFYMTGDLVRYQDDGSLEYVARKDTQAKIRGQRIELGEIEHHFQHQLSGAKGVTVEVVQAAGPNSKPMLAAFIHWSQGQAERNDDKGLKIVAESDIRNDCHATVAAAIAGCLENVLPRYMIPDIFIPLSAIPLNSSGKTDRRRLRSEVSQLPWDYLKQFTLFQDRDELPDKTDQGPVSESEVELHRILCRVLNVEPTKVNRQSSFFQLGGDSITAMQVLTQCQDAGYTLAMADIFREKTVRGIANNMARAEALVTHDDEQEDLPFDLSPIQQSFFEAHPAGEDAFNQSFLLRLRQPVEEQGLLTAIQKLVDRHSMLRARFQQTEGQWKQWITPDRKGSWRFRQHQVTQEEDIKSIMRQSERSLDVKEGPLFIVDWVHLAGGEDPQQYLFIIAHHLVVDLVSWRIVMGELEDMLLRGRTPSAKPLSFQAWCRLQAEHARANLPPSEVLPMDIPSPCLDYWMTDLGQNTAGNAVKSGFTLSEELTSYLMGRANLVLDTQPVDILRAVLLSSFGQVFSDRDVPAVFSEGHGREPWSSQLDLSRTVGWFTTICPIYIPDVSQLDLIEVIRCIRDRSRDIPANGWPYFACRYLHPEGRASFRHHSAMELVFNYAGRYQQLEHADALFSPVFWAEREANFMPERMQLPSLFEVAAGVEENRLVFNFTYSRHLNHQCRISHWIQACEEAFYTASKVLQESSKSLQDFPLLKSVAESTEAEPAIMDSLAKYGITSLCDVEDIYPCRGMLGWMVSTYDRKKAYWNIQAIFELQVPAWAESIDPVRFQKAWRQLVVRHPGLRTIFVPGRSSAHGPLQVIMKRVEPHIEIIECDDSAVLSVLRKEMTSNPITNQHLSHRLVLAQTSSGKVFGMFEAHHAIMDRQSQATIEGDLRALYRGDRLLSEPPLYRDYVATALQGSQDADKRYWVDYLQDATGPVFLPDCARANSPGESISVDVALVRLEKIRQFSQLQGYTSSTMVKAAFAVTFQILMGTQDVAFAYVSASRHASGVKATGTIGTHLELLMARVHTTENAKFQEILEAIQKDYAQALEHPFAAVDTVRELNPGLLNTRLNHRRHPFSQFKPPPCEKETFSWIEHDTIDISPSDFELCVDEFDDGITSYLTYRERRVLPEMVKDFTQAFPNCLSLVLANPDIQLSELAARVRT